MTEQATLFGTDQPIDTELGVTQRWVLRQWRDRGPLDADEVGALMHALRGHHSDDLRCEWCGVDGAKMIASLRERGVLDPDGRSAGARPSGSSAPAVGKPAVTSSAPAFVREETAGLMGVSPAESGLVRPRARSTDPATSHEAARTVGDLRASQHAILELLRDAGGMIDEDLVTAYEARYGFQGWPRQSPSGIRTRRSELTTAGLVGDTGRRARTSSGRKAVVWGLTRTEERQIP